MGLTKSERHATFRMRFKGPKGVAISMSMSLIVHKTNNSTSNKGVRSGVREDESSDGKENKAWGVCTLPFHIVKCVNTKQCAVIIL